MSKFFAVFSVLLMISLSFMQSLEARGRMGRGGGARGGGGRAHTGRSLNRSPSMSRSLRTGSAQRGRVSRSRTPSHRSRQRSRTVSRQQRQPLARTPNFNTPTRNDVRQFLQQKPTTRPADRPSRRPGEGRPGQGITRPDRPSRRPGDRPGQGITRPDRPSRRPGDRSWQRPDRQRRGNREEIANKIQDRIDNSKPDRGNWFDRDFWDRHRYRPPYANYPGNWWRYATAVGVTGWLGWNRTPVYYGYYDNGYWGAVDSNGGYQEYPTTTPDYTETTQAIESATAGRGGDQWMPLGVFALSKEEGTTVTPNLYFQLAMNKEGLISGTFYNTTTDSVYELEGLVDQNSQRAGWKMVDSENSPIVDTGIYNLTQDVAPARVTFADGQTQQMLLVRVNKS